MRHALDVPYSGQTDRRSRPVTKNGRTGGRARGRRQPDSHDQGSYEKTSSRASVGLSELLVAWKLISAACRQLQLVNVNTLVTFRLVNEYDKNETNEGTDITTKCRYRQAV